ncbi:histidine phosphatase family protein [Tropicimonas sp. IMCC6043]|uniref:histidine phosphatase family protein n=1 Tax=Tropicimonas sp. IMCC6043 TaxID=2510645 RepID=UPI001F5C27AC|nr:histidine phosphatase family protein [Tropicimonas sp. IMCC6043]
MLSELLARLLYLSHPQVAIDPAVPVPDWGLNETGRARVGAWIGAGAFAGVVRVVSSAERKAVETARPIATALGCPAEIRPRTHENDRSATGFLPADAFEATADAFFAAAGVSVFGWERALDAQARIVAETADLLKWDGMGDVLLVGHGAVGTLLLCHLAGWTISRRYDQPAGGGNLWAVERPSGDLIHAWRPTETCAPR